MSLTPEEVDYVFDNGILTEDLMTIGADFTGLGSMNIDPRALINAMECLSIEWEGVPHSSLADTYACRAVWEKLFPNYYKN